MEETMDGTSTNKKIQALPMHETQRPNLIDLNNFLMCRLCGGYLIDATGIVECFHTYCRSCIVQFLQNSKFCPICEVQVNKTKPWLSLRSDTIIQRLVYKAVPGLFEREQRHRMQFRLESGVDDSVPDEECAPSEAYFAPQEMFSVALEYIENHIRTKNDPTSKDGIQLNGEPEQITHRRYLKGSAAVKIEQLHKFITLKYNLKNTHEVEILYENVKLPRYYSLMDIAYTFSWTREEPMRLRYQIFERTRVPVPIVIANKVSDVFAPVKPSNFLTNSSSSRSPSSESVKSDSGFYKSTSESETSGGGSSRPNLKRKTGTLVEKREAVDAPESCNDFELREPSVKIPRVTDPATNSDRVESTASPSPINGIEPTAASPPPPPPCEEFANYEQDIEEVGEEEDDDEDRLRISQLSEEDEKMDDACEQLVIDTSDAEKEQRREDRHDEKKSRYKRKSKKSKHHHHHKHHHRHHDRKKAPPQATILHSPDTDIMKLKVKLNNVQPDAKYHKPSKRKRKKSPESYLSSYSSSSSVSSISAPSPDPVSVSRADEDSLHSHTSDLSGESVETSSSKEEPTSTFKADPPSAPAPAKPTTGAAGGSGELSEKLRSPTTKEKLLQMRNFRPKSIAIVRPEEHDKRAVEMASAKAESVADKAPGRPTEHERPKVAAEVLRPTSSSSVTVSKVTALKMEQDKLQMNGSKEDPPALEIIPLVNSAGKPVSSVAAAVYADSAAKAKPSSKSIRPIPPVIPLAHYQKMMSTTEYKLPKSTEYKLPKSLSIHVTTNPKALHLNAEKKTEEQAAAAAIGSKTDGMKHSVKKFEDAATAFKDGMKHNVTFFRSADNFYENDSVLDLSAGKPTVPSEKTTVVNGVRLNGLPGHYSPLHSMTSQANAIRPFQKASTASEMYASKLGHTRYPSTPSPRHQPLSSKMPSASILTAAKSPSVHRGATKAANSGKAGVPHLNEIKIGPSSMATLPKPPRLNQNVRNIPDLSLLFQRQQAQAAANLGMMPNPAAMMHSRLVSTPCSFNMKKNSDMCPPALPISKGYLDRTSIMATK